MGISDFSLLSKEFSETSFSSAVQHTVERMASGASHEELVADPRVMKLGIDSSYMRIKYRCRLLPRVVEKFLESSPHLVDQVLANADEAIPEIVAKQMADDTRDLLNNGVFQVFFFLEGESHLSKICLAKRKEKKESTVKRFDTHVKTYVSEIQRESIAVSTPDDDDFDADEPQPAAPVRLKKSERSSIKTLAHQYSGASCESQHDRSAMVSALAELAEEFPGRLMIVNSQHEAELDAVFFYHIGLITDIFTVDTDTLVYGIPKIITDIMFSGRKPNLLKFRNFTRFECDKLIFDEVWERVAIAVMLGCDYNKRLPGVGRVKVCKKINAIREKMEMAHTNLSNGVDDSSPFANWIKTIDRKLKQEPCSFSWKDYARLCFLNTSVVSPFAACLSEMVKEECVRESGMNEKSWEELKFKDCFVGLMKPLIMASEFKKDETKKQKALSTIDAYKIHGFTSRYL